MDSNKFVVTDTAPAPATRQLNAMLEDDATKKKAENIPKFVKKKGLRLTAG